jgi:hypothetical protein
MTYCENIQHHTYTLGGKAWEWYSDITEAANPADRTPLFHQQIPGPGQQTQSQPGDTLHRKGLCTWAVSPPPPREPAAIPQPVQARANYAPPALPPVTTAGLGLPLLGLGLFFTLLLSSAAVLFVLSKVGNQRHAKQ